MPDTAPSGAVIHDSFDGTGNLNAHTPDIPFASSSWSNNGGFPFNDAFTLSGGSIITAGSGSYIYRRSTTAGFIGSTTDYDCHLGFTFLSGSPSATVHLYLEPRTLQRHQVAVSPSGVVITPANGSTVTLPWVNPLPLGTYVFVITVTLSTISVRVVGGETLFTPNTAADRSCAGMQLEMTSGGSAQYLSLAPAAAPPPPPAPPSAFWTQFANTVEVV